jgi:hypothetical protein
MWTAENRQRYNRDKLRYPSNMKNRRGAVAGGAADSTGQTRRSAPGRRRARGLERHHVCAEHRLPMASRSQGSATAEHSARLSPALELRPHVGEGALRPNTRSVRRSTPARTRQGRANNAKSSSSSPTGLVVSMETQAPVSTFRPPSSVSVSSGPTRPSSQRRADPASTQSARRRQAGGECQRIGCRAWRTGPVWNQPGWEKRSE